MAFRPWDAIGGRPPIEAPVPYRLGIPRDLYGALWQEVAACITVELQKIRLVPVSSERGNISFAFFPQGAFHAGFLQWYFEELAGVDLQVCAADGCTNLVPPERSTYCSDRCMWRMQKQRHRSRKKRAAKTRSRLT